MYQTKDNIKSYKIDIQNHNGRGYTAEMLTFAHHTLQIQERVYWRLIEGPLVQITKLRELTPYKKDEFVYRIDSNPFKYGTEKDLLRDLKGEH